MTEEIGTVRGAAGELALRGTKAVARSGYAGLAQPGLSNPDMSLFLYLAVVLAAVMLSPKWGEFWQAVGVAREAKQAKTTETSDGSAETTKSGNHQ